ncbi:MAG TPA: permease-like cell division protein FtsX [Candidatus Saccharimonadales bacterium]|jgi:cell division transport system permease protein|nr:permease-like cell division protein FtsX [Candidatus Saccharimonadales bacterium]
MNRKMITFSRIITTGMVNFVRNAWLAIAAMAVMIITLTIVLFSIVTNAAFNNTIAQITDKIDVSVYLKDTTDKTKGQELAQGIRELPNAKSVTYLSKDDALKRYKDQNKDNPALLSAINEADNPIPATIQIKPKELNKIQDLRDYLNKSDNKQLWEDVSYRDDRKAAIDKIAHATNLMRRAGVIAVGVFAFISVLIIFNTIQMAIFNRRDEITIMRLLGASTWYIRGPFVVESIIYGIISALISVALIHSLFIASSSALQASSLGLLDINYAGNYFRAHLWQLLLMQLAVGILIGAASSYVATKRYLKFKTTK